MSRWAEGTRVLWTPIAATSATTVAPMFQIVCGQSSKLVMSRAFCPIGITDAALQRQERHRGAHDTPKRDGTTDQGA
jgi:hypothetical protein